MWALQNVVVPLARARSGNCRFRSLLCASHARTIRPCAVFVAREYLQSFCLYLLLERIVWSLRITLILLWKMTLVVRLFQQRDLNTVR